MPEDRTARRQLGYALSAFPYHTLAELWPCLTGDVLAIKQRVFPDKPFPIELRVSEPIVRELQERPDEVLRLRDFFADQQLDLVTVNAFVLPRFHGQPVKERVYLPAWHESEARCQFTVAALDLLGQLTRHTGMVSASVPFGALKPVGMDAVARNILRAGEQARQLHERSGVECVIGLEPEPGLCVETTDEVIEFFSRHVPAELRRYLTVNFDLSHQLVEFEDLATSVAALLAHDIRISKIHISNPAELTRLEPFYADSIYLHQTTGSDAQGDRVWFSLDWPDRPPEIPINRYRVHYHLPVFPSPLPSALGAVETFLNQQASPSALPASVPFIIETYTWPQQLGTTTNLVENICRELEWVRAVCEGRRTREGDAPRDPVRNGQYRTP